MEFYFLILLIFNLIQIIKAEECEENRIFTPCDTSKKMNRINSSYFTTVSSLFLER